MLIYQAYLHAQHYMHAQQYMGGYGQHNTIWVVMLIYQAYLHAQHYMAFMLIYQAYLHAQHYMGIYVNLPSIPACTTLYGQLC